MKTLQILGGNSWGGGCALIREYISFLVAKGWEVEVLTSHPDVIQKLTMPGVKIVSNIVIPRDIEPKADLIALKALRRHFSENHYDVVHTYNTMAGLVGRTAAKFSKGQKAIFHHQAGWNLGEGYSAAKSIIFWPAELWGIWMSTQSICCSKTIRSQADRYRLFPKSKLTTVCNGIDPLPFQSALSDGSRESFRKRLGVAEGSFLIGCHGRLSDLKNNSVLLQALEKVLKEQPDVYLALAGDGAERQNLEKLADELGIADRVRFLGYCTEIPQFLAALDLFAMASLREGMSISIMEAMAAAQPIVCSNIPQNTELIQDEVTGIAVNGRDPAAFAKAILRLKSSPETAKELGLSAQRSLIENYSLQQFLEQTYEVYSRALNRKR